MKLLFILLLAIIFSLGFSPHQDYKIAETTNYLETNFSAYNKAVDDYRIISAVLLSEYSFLFDYRNEVSIELFFNNYTP